MGIQLSCPNQHYLIFWVGTSIYLDACSSIINELILVEEKEEDENINKQTTTVTNCLVLVAPSHSTPQLHYHCKLSWEDISKIWLCGI